MILHKINYFTNNCSKQQNIKSKVLQEQQEETKEVIIEIQPKQQSPVLKGVELSKTTKFNRQQKKLLQTYQQKNPQKAQSLLQKIGLGEKAEPNQENMNKLAEEICQTQNSQNMAVCVELLDYLGQIYDEQSKKFTQYLQFLGQIDRIIKWGEESVQAEIQQQNKNNQEELIKIRLKTHEILKLFIAIYQFLKIGLDHLTKMQSYFKDVIVTIDNVSHICTQKANSVLDFYPLFLDWMNGFRILINDLKQEPLGAWKEIKQQINNEATTELWANFWAITGWFSTYLDINWPKAIADYQNQLITACREKQKILESQKQVRDELKESLQNLIDASDVSGVLFRVRSHIAAKDPETRTEMDKNTLLMLSDTDCITAPQILPLKTLFVCNYLELCPHSWQEQYRKPGEINNILQLIEQQHNTLRQRPSTQKIDQLQMNKIENNDQQNEETTIIMQSTKNNDQQNEKPNKKNKKKKKKNLVAQQLPKSNQQQEQQPFESNQQPNQQAEQLSTIELNKEITGLITERFQKLLNKPNLVKKTPKLPLSKEDLQAIEAVIQKFQKPNKQLNNSGLDTQAQDEKSNNEQQEETKEQYNQCEQQNEETTAIIQPTNNNDQQNAETVKIMQSTKNNDQQNEGEINNQQIPQQIKESKDIWKLEPEEKPNAETLAQLREKRIQEWENYKQNFSKINNQIQ